jgi:hypothetical protein
VKNRFQSLPFKCDLQRYNAEAASQRQAASRWISHLNHHGEVVGVDHVW